MPENPQSEYASIGVDAGGDVARITLDRPPLNVLDIAMMRECNRALEELASNDAVKLLVIDHQGKAFSVGVDIKDHTPDKVESMLEVFHRMFRLLESLAMPTLALVDGAALGGGCELATFCDMILASDRARFGQPEIQIGVFPPVAALVLPRWIGRNRALELLLTGDVIDAEEAWRLGLVNKVFPAGEFRSQADAFIARLTSLSSPVLRLTKNAADRGKRTGFDAGIAGIEKVYLEELMQTEDAHEGLAAFLEKRQPQWKNR
jgi:cyclohexa-1,5-dienecarbonyl-CoA hydratase